MDRFSGTVMGRFMSVRRGNSANNALHFLLAREVMNRELIPQHERWFLIAGRILQFTPQAFCLVTGLSFGAANFDPTDDHRIPKNGVHATHFKKPIKVDDLRKSFKLKDMGEDPEDYIKVANLLVYYYWLLCRDKQVVKNWAWALVEEPEEWELFPWGAYAYLNLIHYIKHTAVADQQTEKRLYHFYGAVWALQIWSYEVIPHLGRLCGQRDEAPRFPRVLMWDTKQAKVDFSNFFDRPVCLCIYVFSICLIFFIFMYCLITYCSVYVYFFRAW